MNEMIPQQRDNAHFLCWQCSRPLENVILPLSRREECASCRADQHVCKMCVFFQDSGRGDCREDRADWVSDRERANFCDYFKPVMTDIPSSPQSGDFPSNSVRSAQEQAAAEFAALFGEEETRTATTDTDKQEKTPKSAAEIAEQQLRDMLGD